jgi:hypothetical protein
MGQRQAANLQQRNARQSNSSEDRERGQAEDTGLEVSLAIFASRLATLAASDRGDGQCQGDGKREE